MGINMHIKDTWEVTMEELMSMLPNSKATKQVNKLMDEVVKLQHELEKRRDNVEDEEANRWCERLEWLHTEYGADSSGCDSGDPLDCVEVEIRQAITNAEKKIAREICSYLFSASPVASPNTLIGEISNHYELEI